MNMDCRQLFKITTRLFVLLFLFSQSFSLVAEESDFNHDKTGFELVGPHERISCDSCHIRGIFKGTPKRCEACHDLGSPIATSLKPIDHIVTSGTCEDCHAGNTWVVTGFDHDSITGSCINCHNGVTATGKTANHLASGTVCDDCHNTIAWTPAGYDHDSASGICSSCHNGVTATGPSSSHFQTSLQCDSCHRTNFWSPDIYAHAGTDYPGDHASDPTCVKCHTANNSSLSWNATYVPDCAACHVNDYKQDEHDKDVGGAKYTVGELQNCATSSCHTYNLDGSINKSRSAEHSVNKGDW